MLCTPLKWNALFIKFISGDCKSDVEHVSGILPRSLSEDPVLRTISSIECNGLAGAGLEFVSDLCSVVLSVVLLSSESRDWTRKK